MIKKDKMQIIIWLLIAIVIIVVVAVLLRSAMNRSNYGDFVAGDEIVWTPTGLSLEAVIDNNKEILSLYNIDLEIVNEDDFYFDGQVWSAVLISDDGIPYNVVIDKEFIVTIYGVDTDSEKVDE